MDISLFCFFKEPQSYLERPTLRTSLKPNCLPRVSHPNAITLEVRASTQEFPGDTNVQSFSISEGGREMDRTGPH